MLLEVSLFEFVPGAPQLHDVVAWMHAHGFVVALSLLGILICVVLVPGFVLRAGMGTLKQTEPPIVDAIGGFVPPTTASGCGLTVWAGSATPYGRA